MKLLYAFSRELKDTDVQFPQEDINLFKQIYKLDADGWLVDRSGSVNFPFNEQLLDRYPFPTPVLTTFADACIDHANELLDLNQKIHILWSGGIDSTAIVVSFIQTGRPLDNVIIVLNYDSIKEYSAFYEKHIRGKFKILVTEEAMMLMTTSSIDGIVLSGEHADQLIGTPLANFLHQGMPKGFLERPFTFDNFKELFRARGIDEKATECWFSIYNTTIQKSPRPIETMYDLAWWHGFNFKWQSTDLKIYLRIKKEVNFKTFYSGNKFQAWSCTVVPNLKNINSVKSEQKQFILDFTQDADYFSNKMKHPSSTLYYAVKAAPAIDKNFNKLFNFSLKAFYNSDNSISKWLNNL